MRSMLILATVVSAFLTVILVFFQTTRRTYPGFRRWTAGVGCLTLGYALFCMRGFIPDSLSILAGNVAFPLGMVLHLKGLRRFLGVRPMSRLWYALPAIDFILIAFLYFVHDSAQLRHLVNSIAISAPHWPMALLIFRYPRKPKSIFYPAIGVTIGLAGLVVLIRPMVITLLPEWHLLADSPFQTVTMGMLIVLQLGENLSLIMLNSERVERDLVEAEAGQRMAVVQLQEALAEQKRVQESLRESEERYRTFFDTSRDCVFMTAVDGSFIDFNNVALDVFGFKPEERDDLSRMTVADVYADPAQRQAHVELVSRLGFSKEYPVDLRKRDGGIIHAQVTAVVRKDPQGNVIGFQGTVRDVTERKRAEEILRNTLQRFYTILSSMYAGVLLVTDDGRVEFANQAFCDLFDLTDVPTDLSGKGAPEIIASIRDAYADPAHAVARIGEIVSLQAPVRGEEIPMRGGRTYLRDYVPIIIDGNRFGRLWYHLDITERKHAEEALRASEEKYKLLVEKAREGIFVVQDTLFRFVNPRLEEIVGYSSDELIGNSFAGFVHPDDREMVVNRHKRRLQGEAFPSRYEIRIVDRQDAVKWVEIDSAVIDWEGKPAAMVFMNDITYRKLAEETAVQTERLRAIADLSGGVAHHFNNLLQIVMGGTSLSLLELESGEPDQAKATLDRMLVATTHGAETVRRLQTFANTRADFAQEDVAVFDIAGTASNAIEMSQSFWRLEPEKKGVKVDLHTDLEKGCLVQGKENEIFEVLVELIRNAAESLPDGGALEVRTLKRAEEVLVVVRDSGVGIERDAISRIFEPFWSTKGVGIGKGMGLAVAHGLVKRHGGTLSVESTPGEGSTFTLVLPRAQAPVTKAEPEPVGPTGHRLTVLVIEDEDHIASLLERVLQRAGHAVFKTLSGEEGLAVFRSERIDVVLCDLGMPGMSGWDVGKAIGSICREKGVAKPPFVLLTGWGGQDLEKEKLAESGTDAVLAKPIDSAKFLGTIQEIAERFSIPSRVT